MKYKSILLFVLLVAIIASFNFISCQKDEPESGEIGKVIEVEGGYDQAPHPIPLPYIPEPRKRDTIPY